MIIFVLPIAVLLGWLQDMQGKDLAGFVGAIAIAYYAGRIIANVLFDSDREAAYKANTYRHFKRPSFAMWVDKQGKLHVKGDPDERDHSQRCQDSLKEWHTEERWLRWNNWRYAFNIVFIAVMMDKML